MFREIICILRGRVFSEKTIFRTSWKIYFLETTTKRHFRGCMLTAKFKVEEQKTATLLECRKLVQRKALNLFLRDTNRSVIDLNSRLRNANREKSIKDRNWNQFQISLLNQRLVYQIELMNVYFMLNLSDFSVATIENLIASL